jgi:hypothetical protein
VHLMRRDRLMDHTGHTRALGSCWVSPIGFGAMRLAGPNVFGPPKDRSAAIVVLAMSPVLRRKLARQRPRR